jgi:DNA-binding CsgD family transcriptional regulator
MHAVNTVPAVRTNGSGEPLRSVGSLDASEVPVRSGGQKLTPKEVEVVRQLLADRTCKEAAAALDISNRTAAHYVERMKLRFGRTTLHGLVVELLRLGLV